MSERITILGAGSWGMAVARLLDNNGKNVTLWEFDQAEFNRLVRLRGIPEKLKSFSLAPSITITHDLADALDGCEILVLAVPAQFVRSVIRPVGERMALISGGIVNLAKGIEAGTLKRVSEVILDEAPVSPDRIITMSGPSHAEEVILDVPTTVVAGGKSIEMVERVQAAFSNTYFRVYKSDDVVGVELGGSLKNIIAIAAGITDGLGLGDNTKGALITRGLAEITRLGLAMGARAETFAGLSGVGDLVTTCYSQHSRNRYVGEQIAKGRKLREILENLKMVAEGVETTRSGYKLARLRDVEMPITNEVYEVLFRDKPPSEALQDLMGRELKAEIWK